MDGRTATGYFCDGAGDLFELAAIARRQAEIDAFACQFRRNRGTNSAAGPGYQGDLSL